MAKTRSEDTLILNGLTPGITKMNPIYNALKHFFEIKKSIDHSSRFNIILFQEDGPNYLEQFTLYPENVLVALKSLEPIIVRGNIGGGIFVAISFIIDVFKKVSEKTFRLIILTDSGTPIIPNLYLPVLQNLIDQVKDMPFFIDIIRLDVENYEEDKKLMDLAKRCNGGIHEINKAELLEDILEFLALKREIDARNLIEGENYRIPAENHYFFENLADNPLEIVTKETCSICHKQDDKPKIKCNNCGILTHKACWAQWTTKSSIGIPHVFRCHNCYNLVKLEKNYVERIRLAEKVKLAKLLPETDLDDIHDYLKSLETEAGPKMITVEDPMSMSQIVRKNPNLNEVKEENIPILEEDNTELRFILCPYCHKMITNNYKICPNCHRNLK